MLKKDKTKFSSIKVICICLILVLLSVSGAMAMTTTVNTVKIQLSNGYEMTILTSKTNVKQILDDNNIILEANEKSIPGLDEEITDSKVIKITDKSTQEIEIAKVQESGVEMTLDSLLQAYSAICEKIEVVEEAIPFETITKDVSENGQNTRNRVLQNGVEGLKKVTDQYTVILHRTEAIRHAIKMATKDDIIVIPGLGNDLYIEYNGVKYPYNERTVIHDIIEELINQ